MKWKLMRFATIAVLVANIWAVKAFSQDPVSDGWVRVQTDDHEFSIEVPVKSAFCIDNGGFSISNGSTNFDLRNMKMLNSFSDGNLLSFEIYSASRKALDDIYYNDTYSRPDLNASVTQRKGYSIKEIIQKTDKFYLVRRYFYSKNSIYVLTAGSRTGETPGIRRFLDSMVFDPVSKSVDTPGARMLSTLKTTSVIMDFDLDRKPAKTAKSLPADPKPPQKDDSVKPLTILLKPKPSYVDAARMKAIAGTIIVAVTFSSNAFLTKMVVKKTLPEGLLRQVLFAAMRMKFLPQEKDGKPESVEKHVEYTFSIY